MMWRMAESDQDDAEEEPTPLPAEKVPPLPVECLEPRIHPEVVQHGAALASLAIQLARLKAGDPMDCLSEAGKLLEAAIRLVPSVGNISRLSPDERDAYARTVFLAEQGDEEFVPWEWICQEGARIESVKPKLLRLEIGGKTQPYFWKPYRQAESKRGGVRELFLKHAHRVGFEKPEQTNAIEHLRAMLEDLELDEEKIAPVLSDGGLEWTAKVLAGAIAGARGERGSSEWAASVIDEWTSRSVQDSADRLFAAAKAGRLRKIDFFELAITRKLHPPGGRE
jgi:hypothetical protein